jgi:hypothetical protein
MRWTIVDRFLLVCFLLSASFLGPLAPINPICDTKCQMIDTYQFAGPKTVCVALLLLDCNPCKNNSQCVVPGPTPPNCTPGAMIQKYAEISDCRLLCTLAPGLRAEAERNVIVDPSDPFGVASNCLGP